jgi:hypothetical protein
MDDAPDGTIPAGPAADSPDEPIGESRLHVAVAAPVSSERAAAVLGPGRGRWLGERVGEGDEDGATRYLLNLELRVLDQAPRVAFHKAAYVDVGEVERVEDGDALSLGISWRAAGMTPLFPVFAGTLRWVDGELLLDGFYAPPGGAVGLVADRLLLHVAARGTARRLLERIAAEMTAAAR